MWATSKERLLAAAVVIIAQLAGTHELLTAQIDTDHWDRKQEPRASSQFQAPEILSPPMKLVAQEGNRILLPCVVRNLGDDQVLWRHGSNILAGSNFSTYSDDFGRIRLFQNFSLEISNVTATDDGVYECFFASPHHSHKLTHLVTVQDRPTVAVLPAKGVVIVNETDSVRIGCIPHGNPKPRISWNKRDGQLPENVHKQFSQSVITMEQVSRKHTGLYECYADNGVGLPAVGAVYVRVLHTPEVEVPKARVHGGVGYKAQLTCIVHADPKAQITWLLGQKPVQLDKRIFAEQRDIVHTLTITHVRDTDFGTYTCTANSSFGYDLRNIELTGIPTAPVVTRWEAIPDFLVDELNKTSGTAKLNVGDSPPKGLIDSGAGSPGSGYRQGGEVSSDSVDYDVHVQLLWAVECYSQLIDYRLSFRPAPMPAAPEELSTSWTELSIPADKSTAFLHTKSFVLRSLHRDKIYEAVIKARNKYGWSPISLVCYFSTYINSTSQNVESVKRFFSSLDTSHDTDFGYGFFNQSMFYAKSKESNHSNGNGTLSDSGTTRFTGSLYAISLVVPLLQVFQ